jgi:hypothetical protein
LAFKVATFILLLLFSVLAHFSQRFR